MNRPEPFRANALSPPLPSPGVVCILFRNAVARFELAQSDVAPILSRLRSGTLLEGAQGLQGTPSSAYTYIPI